MVSSSEDAIIEIVPKIKIADNNVLTNFLDLLTVSLLEGCCQFWDQRMRSRTFRKRNGMDFVAPAVYALLCCRQFIVIREDHGQITNLPLATLLWWSSGSLLELIVEIHLDLFDNADVRLPRKMVAVTRQLPPG
jgi:hypothetical protein